MRSARPLNGRRSFWEIEDLRFHDLRHEGVSHLFEIGYNVPYAAAVSGHRSGTSPKRYTHLRQTRDKFGAWTRIAKVTTSSPRQRKRRPARSGSPAKIRTASILRSS